MRRKGFTLIEMLVAMAMIAVLAGSLYASMRIAFAARITSEAALAPVTAAEAVFDALGRDLACALPPTGILAGPFIGTDADDSATGLPSDTAEFSTRPMSTQGTAPGIIRVSYGLAADGEAKAVRRQVTVNLLAPEEPQPQEEILCRGVSAMNLRYFDGADWFDMWDSTAAGGILPTAVEVVLRIAGREGEWEEFRQVFVLPCRGQPSGQAGAAVSGGMFRRAE